ncbi:MAG: DinB family protein [Acidobacteriota bacterium]|nr:DinB family protein [Acidobacteriota bacterium]
MGIESASTLSSDLSAEAFHQRPAPEECAPFYHGYIGRVPDGDVRRTLERLGEELATLLENLGEERAGDRYAPGKWTVAQVVGHVNDTERVFSHRIVWFARRDPAPLPGIDQDPWVEAGEFEGRSLAALVAELRAIRASTRALVQSLTPQMLERRGVASDAPCTVRALVWILAGHAEHHRRIVEERYL